MNRQFEALLTGRASSCQKKYLIMRGGGMFPNEEKKYQANDLLKEPRDKEVAEYIKQRVIEEIVEYVVSHENK